MYNRQPFNSPGESPQWVGRVRPYIPKPRAVPVYQERKILAERGNGKFSTFSIKLLGASQDFPTVSVNIALGSGTGVAFASLSPKEFTDFLASLNQWATEILGLVPNLERAAEQVRAVREQTDRTMAAIRQQALQQQLAEQEDITPGLPF